MIERTPAVIAGEINYIKRQAQQVMLGASVEIGRKLNEAKSLVPHGEWESWLSQNVEYSQSTANNLMRIATEYGDEQISLFSGTSNSETFANLTYSQAVALFALPVGERAEFVENHDIGEMSIRELKDALAAEKEKNAKSAEIIARMEEEADEAERDYNRAADDLEEKQKALQDALKGKRDAEAMLETAKKLADANAKEKDKAVKAKAAAEKKEADLMKQLDAVTAQIRELEAAAKEPAEPEQITMEAAVSEDALAAQREAIAEEERAKIREEYERKLAAVSNPDVQRCALYFETFCADFHKMVNGMRKLPEENRKKIGENVRNTLERMMEEFADE